MNEDSWLRQALKRVGITQKELAKRFGVRDSAVCNWHRKMPVGVRLYLDTLIELTELKVVLEWHRRGDHRD